jgi:hypothetical protein
MGLLSMVEAGLAAAPFARCAVPAQLLQLGQAHGLPEIDPLEVILARSSKSKRPQATSWPKNHGGAAALTMTGS